MEGKLIKLEESKYTLVYKEGSMALEHNPAFDGKLSLKNCEAIENGYDLDEVVEDIVKTIVPNDRGEDIWYGTSMAVGKLCFQKALEILGDKKFSEKDMSKAWSEGYHRKVDELNGNGLRYFDKFIQSLQQTEWDVEIEMWFHGTRHKKGEWIPKLDAEGCLILKRK